MMRIPTFSAMLAALAAAACSGGDGQTFTDPAQTIQVAPGSEFRIELAANHSTGYQWKLVDTGAMGTLRSTGSRYEVPRRDRDRDGAGGSETWTFQAPSAGEGIVSLVYARDGENAAPGDTTRFRVVVR